MFIRDNKAYASIGVNCLPEVQLLKRFHIWKNVEPEPKDLGYRQERGLFDTGGASPDSLIEILNLIKEDKAIDLLSDIDNYYAELRPEGNIFYGHKFIHGFTLTHEDEDLTNFKKEMKNRINNFNNLPKETTFIWCNAQANFTPDFKCTGTFIDDYYLTVDRYEKIMHLVKHLYGFKVKFAVREEYTEKSLLNFNNVIPIDIEFGNFNLFGTKKQFDPIFQEE